MWEVKMHRKAGKALMQLPSEVQRIVTMLQMDLQNFGPVRGDWPNYSKLSGNRHHCHLKKGKPTYVAVWQVVNNEIQIIEVTYVGTHERAPY